MTTRHTYTAIAALLVCSLSARAQDQGFWALERCIAQAKEMNIDLKISRNDYRKAELGHRQNLWDMGPQVNGYASSTVDFQRSTNQNNQIESGTTYSVGYGLTGSMNLFAGFTAHNRAAAGRFYKLAAAESTQLAEYQLVTDITSLYANALYQKALIDVAREKYETSLYEAQRIVATIEAGQLEQVALDEINATVSENRLQLSRVQNDYLLTKLQLAQAIETPNDSAFDISDATLEAVLPQQTNLGVDSLYLITCTVYPSVRQSEYEMDYYKKLLHVARGTLAPSLSLLGGYTSGFYSTDTLDNGKKTPFSTQFDNYRNPYMGLSLNVPLWGARQKSYQAKMNKIDLENAVLAYENKKKQLRRELEEAVFKLNALYLEYVAAADNLVFTEKSFGTYREKFRMGMIGTTDFMNAQNLYSQARSNVMLARFSWAVQQKTLQLYLGNYR
ncbi:MAG: TolC family protein [Breznakibacter sp.]